MIYSRDTPKNSQSSTGIFQGDHSAQPLSQPAPPSYDSYQEISQNQLLLNPRSPLKSEIFIPRQSVGRRFLRAFIAAIGIWALLSFLVKTTFHRGSHGNWSMEDWRYDIPHNLNIDHCIEGDEWTPITNALGLSPQVDVPISDNSEWDRYNLRYRAETSFILPLSSDTLFLLSRGQDWNGAVQIKTSSEQANDSVKVHIVLRYNHEKVIERVKACLLEKRIDENGVGIFAPIYIRDKPPREQTVATFQIIATLPELGHSSPLHISNFETDVPNSKHEVEDLGHKVLFKSISLHGSNGRVHVKSLTATDGNFRTNNGGISGTFNTTNKLSLLTTNGAIGVDVNLKSEDNSFPELKAQTSNGALAANVRLHSTSGKGGYFNVITSTAYGRIDVRVPESPVDSVLNLAARTSHDRAVVFLNPAYEGSFNLQTSSASPLTVHKNLDVEDPSGNNRKRLFRYTQRGNGFLAGEIVWSNSRQPREDFGTVTISTLNAPVLLDL